MKTKVSLFQEYNKSVFTTQKVKKGSTPKKVRTGSVSVFNLLLINEFTVKDNVKINTDKLAKTLTKAMARRYEAKVVDNIDTGFKVSKECFIRVEMDDKLVFDLKVVKMRSSVQSKIKINPTRFQEDKDLELNRIEHVILYTVNDAKISIKELQGIFE